MRLTCRATLHPPTATTPASLAADRWTTAMPTTFSTLWSHPQALRGQRRLQCHGCVPGNQWPRRVRRRASRLFGSADYPGPLRGLEHKQLDSFLDQLRQRRRSGPLGRFHVDAGRHAGCSVGRFSEQSPPKAGSHRHAAGFGLVLSGLYQRG